MKLTSSEPDIRTVVQRIDDGDIDLQPDFQRQEVWPIAKKRKLIDTILRGWSIPPVHLVETLNHKLEVLDGQQRLAAVRDFLHDRFSIDGRITPFDGAIASLHGTFYSQLELSIRRKVDQYSIRCFRIQDYQPEEPSELFYRLNQPTALTAGEQRNALYGPARSQMKELVNYFEGRGNNKGTIGFSNARLAYDDVIARLLVFLEARDFGAKSTESRVSERFRSQDAFSNQAYDRARLAITFFSDERDFARPQRFNKASVLSWLLFYSRFTDDEPASGFLLRYQDALSSREFRAAFELFNNRASLRVTDVSSVVIRDVLLLVLYHLLTRAPLPPTIDHDTVLQVARGLPSESHDLELMIMDTVSIYQWSSTL